jgi:hypothetical protein
VRNFGLAMIVPVLLRQLASIKRGPVAAAQ